MPGPRRSETAPAKRRRNRSERRLAIDADAVDGDDVKSWRRSSIWRCVTERRVDGAQGVCDRFLGRIKDGERVPQSCGIEKAVNGALPDDAGERSSLALKLPVSVNEHGER